MHSQVTLQTLIERNDRQTKKKLGNTKSSIFTNNKRQREKERNTYLPTLATREDQHTSDNVVETLYAGCDLHPHHTVTRLLVHLGPVLGHLHLDGKIRRHECHEEVARAPRKGFQGMARDHFIPSSRPLA